MAERHGAAFDGGGPASDRDGRGHGTSAVDDTVRVVVSVAGPGRVHRMVRNLMAAADLPVELELVCHGEGLDVALAGGDAAEVTRRLQAAGVTVCVCANTMRVRGVDADALLPGVRVVPAAVWHLARRQHQGWAYLQA